MHYSHNDIMIKIPEQKKVSPFWGGLKELLGRAMFYIGIINFILITITAYHTSIKDIMPIPFWIFFLLLFIGLLILMILEYVIILPSSIAFSNRQSYKHDNPVKDDINKILSKLENMEKDIKAMNQLLNSQSAKADSLKLINEKDLKENKK